VARLFWRLHEQIDAAEDRVLDQEEGNEPHGGGLKDMSNTSLTVGRKNMT
jgi:hypothetical protein